MTNIWTYDLSRWLYKKNIPLIPRILGRLTRLLYSCEIPYTADIHSSVSFPHKGLGVVIGHDTIIGENTKILQNVTIGGRSGIRANPVIGKNVMVGAGAIILGDITINDNAHIGANAVIIKDVPFSATSVGVPGRVIQRNS